jgi:hypothetical protein
VVFSGYSIMRKSKRNRYDSYNTVVMHENIPNFKWLYHIIDNYRNLTHFDTIDLHLDHSLKWVI